MSARLKAFPPSAVAHLLCSLAIQVLAFFFSFSVSLVVVDCLAIGSAQSLLCDILAFFTLCPEQLQNLTLFQHVALPKFL